MSMLERRRRNWGIESGSHEQPLLQERFQILLQRIGWSYAALWTLNPQTRVLEWRRGHFQIDAWAGTTTSQPKVWYAQQFCAAYRSCNFAPGAGFVGRAYEEAMCIWLRGDLVSQNAGSLQQAQFLRDANIKTVMCVPWLESILELGTTYSVEEDIGLMSRIQQVMAYDLLSLVPDGNDVDNEADVSGFVGYDQAVTVTNSSPELFNQGPNLSTTSWPPLKPFEAATSTISLPVGALDRSSFQSAFTDNLNGWRSDIFMHEPDTQQPDVAAVWSLARKAGGHLSTGLIAEQSESHGLMISPADTGQYGSCTDSFGSSTAATTASPTSNRSSEGDNHHSSSPARPASVVASPDQLQCQPFHVSAPFLGSIQADRASSSGRRPHGLHIEAELAFPKPSTDATGANLPQLRRTTSCGDQYGILKALSLFDAQETPSDQAQEKQIQAEDLQQQQQQQKHNPASASTLQPGLLSRFLFPVDVDTPSLSTNPDSASQSELMLGHVNLTTQQGSRAPQPLLRRHSLSAMDVLTELDAYAQAQAQAADHAGYHAADQAAGQRASETAYESVDEDFKFFYQPSDKEMYMPRSRSRSRGSSSSRGASGPQVPSHGDAAATHMMAERKRRLKQKENFAKLRRLVPLISKADKASTLVDAIAYLKSLQDTVVLLETNKETVAQRCRDLADKCVELEEQNRELVAILSKGKLGTHQVHENVTWQIKTS